MASSVMEYFRVISIHALREEGDSRATSRAPQSRNFYPRPPRGGRPAGCSGGEKETASISIHALREEGDRFKRRQDVKLTLFLSTPSARRATDSDTKMAGAAKISIHALREEGDSDNKAKKDTEADFYPRPPRGGRQHSGTRRPSLKRFLSTPSARRATLALYELLKLLSNFYPRPPRGGRQGRGRGDGDVPAISIHALREEGDSTL